jgi:ribonuclease HI
MAQGRVYTIHTDGAARGNPGPAAFAYVIRCDGALVARDGGKLGSTTNNLAEYTALVHGLEHALRLKADHVIVNSDSELMVKQMNGLYKVKNEGIRELHDEAKSLIRQLGKVVLRHVRRAENSEADQLCNDVLDGNFVPGDGTERGNESNDTVPASLPQKENLDEAAVAYLMRVAVAWTCGDPVRPTPKAVWEHLRGLFTDALKRGEVGG